MASRPFSVTNDFATAGSLSFSEVIITVRSRLHGLHSELFSASTLRFRTEKELRFSITMHGFDVAQMLGGWKREPIGTGHGEFLIITRAV